MRLESLVLCTALAGTATSIDASPLPVRGLTLRRALPRAEQAISTMILGTRRMGETVDSKDGSSSAMSTAFRSNASGPAFTARVSDIVSSNTGSPAFQKRPDLNGTKGSGSVIPSASGTNVTAHSFGMPQATARSSGSEMRVLVEYDRQLRQISAESGELSSKFKCAKEEFGAECA
ncbi:hypothetical protein B2J93_1269 [Marssonina coronariae]|uniref:Uncharacterized protein n=1 Tax=Diplocarpon coronariae TaxID=2795749 RepID=A0A218Z2Q4_9HELO|nr:hypothetical protein B2J93_1269 [Marssonina coronariae]